MPIVAHNNSPSLHRIADEGLEILTLRKAHNQDIRELHIGFLNMMPDAAFLATERQFFRLIAAATHIVQIYIHPIKCQEVLHCESIQSHIDTYYEDFKTIKQQGLDAVIVTGANPQFNNLHQEAYWQEATEIFDWAKSNVSSVFFSCLASHALLQAQYDIYRKRLNQKLWGIYSHQISDKKHPLVRNLNTRFDMPHSRLNDISESLFTDKNLNILASSKQAGVAIATSSDGFKQIFCQGHPEYDTSSLFKEYKREIKRFIDKQREDYPSFPENCSKNTSLIKLVDQTRQQIMDNSLSFKDFPDQVFMDNIDNTWRDTAKALFSNWISLVYKTTSYDRKQQFMKNIDPNNPLKDWY